MAKMGQATVGEGLIPRIESSLLTEKRFLPTMAALAALGLGGVGHAHAQATAPAKSWQTLSPQEQSEILKQQDAKEAADRKFYKLYQTLSPQQKDKLEPALRDWELRINGLPDAQQAAEINRKIKELWPAAEQPAPTPTPTAVQSTTSTAAADPQTAFNAGYKQGASYAGAGVELIPSDVEDTAEIKAYRNGYPNEGPESLNV